MIPGEQKQSRTVSANQMSQKTIAIKIKIHSSGMFSYFVFLLNHVCHYKTSLLTPNYQCLVVRAFPNES